MPTKLIKLNTNISCIQTCARTFCINNYCSDANCRFVKFAGYAKYIQEREGSRSVCHHTKAVDFVRLRFPHTLSFLFKLTLAVSSNCDIVETQE